jgi:hypothetical protein
LSFSFHTTVRTARAFSLGFGLLVLAAAAPAPTLAQDAPPLFARPSTVLAAPGETVSVDVRLGAATEHVAGVYFVGFQVHYDPDVFELLSAPRGSFIAPFFTGLDDPLEVRRSVDASEDLDSDGQPDGETYYAYSVALLGQESNPPDGSGTVLVLNFRVQAGAPAGIASLRLEETLVTKPDADPDDALPPEEIAARVLPGFVGITSGGALPEGIGITRDVLSLASSTALPLGSGFDPATSLSFAPLSANAEVTAVRDPSASVMAGLLPPGYAVAAPGMWTLLQTGEPDVSATFCLPLSASPELIDPPQLRFAYRPASDFSSEWSLITPTLLPESSPTQACATLGALGTLALTAPPAALPVELAGFAALRDEDSVVLRWETLSERDNAGFSVEVQRASQGRWSVVGFVDGAGTTTEGRSYTFRLGDLQPEIYRFRLAQIDYDGAVDYSPELEVDLRANDALSLSAPYPNPSPGASRVTLTLARATPLRMTLHDALGREVGLLHDGVAEAGQRSILIDTSAFAPGVYVLRAVGPGLDATRTLIAAP